MACSRCGGKVGGTKVGIGNYSGTLTTADMAAAVTSPVDPIDPGHATPTSWVVPALIAGVAILLFWGTLTQRNA